MKTQNKIIQIIQNELETRKLVNPSYSLRQFAKDAQTQPAAISSFLKGKRNFSKKMALKVLQNLGIDDQVILDVQLSFSEEKGMSKEQRQKGYERLQLQNSLYHIIANPLYYSYLSLIETEGFINNDEENAVKLQTTASKIEKIKKELIKLGFIKKRDNKLIPTESVLASSDNIPNHSLRSRHIQNMDDSKKALQQVPVDQRYFAFETLSFDEEDLPIVQKKINLLMDELIWMSKKASNKDKIVEFCSHYFPRSFEN